ncbi:hypothetical protein [Ferrovibrio terrae]|uniref:hypothetical protein n=1 Tax=Ferrovibrio terrae TaxID=2594003 RepID=UPI00313840FB
MSYSSKTLSVLGYANGFTLWHYSTPDAHKTVGTNGYFNAAAEMLRPGDFILANTGVGGSPQHGIFVVATNLSGQVELADLAPGVGGAETKAAEQPEAAAA